MADRRRELGGDGPSLRFNPWCSANPRLRPPLPGCRCGTGRRFGSCPPASSVVVPGTGVEPVRPCGPADFTYHHSFRYTPHSVRFVVWTIPLPYAVRHLGRGRLVSTLSHASHGLSSGSPSARPVKGSPNLTPVHPRVSPWGTLTSPLRLPVPPPGQEWRLRSESNRRTRLCRPLHDHSATQPFSLGTSIEGGAPPSIDDVPGAGNETRTRDPNLGKVVLYQLSYSRELNAVL